MSADEETNRRANVEGTKHAVDLANRLRAKHFHHASSIAVSGRYRGPLPRRTCSTRAKSSPTRTRRPKFESEKIVRERAQVPWRVYRPGIVVGHSQTGEMDKVDGPYYFFKVIQRLRQALPPWMPVIGLEGGPINIVPARLRGRGDGPHRARRWPRRPGIPHHRPESEDGRAR
jgi:nucleoside-diphosphate-sugar epimerase